MGMVCDSVAKKQLTGGKTVHKADGINPVYEVEYKGKDLPCTSLMSKKFCCRI